MTIELVLKSSLLLTAAAALAALLSRKSAALRHLIWTLAFVGLLLLPLIARLLPTLPAPVPTFKTEAVAYPVKLPPIPAAAPGLTLNLLLTLLGATGTAIGLTQMLIGCLTLERLRSQAPAFAPKANGVTLLESRAGTMPMAYGLFRPVIFLPADAKLWPPARLKVVLRHERAHIQRYDPAIHILGRLALSLYWWNPLVWFAWREFLKEQERATDDLVLAQGTPATEYAEHLLHIARALQPALAGPAVAMLSSQIGKTSQFTARMESILDTTRNRTTPRKASVLAAIASAVLLIVPLAAMQTEPAQTDLRRGIAELAAKHYQAALADFEQARAHDSKVEAAAFLWEAIAQLDLQNTEQSAKLFEGAVNNGDPHSIDTAAAMEIYSRFLDSHGQPDRAQTMREKAAEIRRSQPPAPVTNSQTVFHAGGDVQPPALLKKVEPQYSTEARVAQYDGVVILTVIVGADGKTRDIQVRQPLGLGLDQKAIDAVSQWTFKPGQKDGHPVDVRATIEVSFRLL